MATRLSSPVTAFDSSTVLLEALSNLLHGRDYQLFGISSATAAILSALGAMIPRALRSHIYARGGRKEAVAPEALGRFDAEESSKRVVARYPARRYPAVAIGSSNGAAIHLCAALQVPWLPQNLLMLVRQRGLDPDDPKMILSRGQDVAEPLLARNPELALHHMVDPSQDRLMSREALYFRLKRRRLGRAFETFLVDRLMPSGTLLLIECGLSWPVKRVRERHYFQFGGVGGLSPREYVEGSPRIAAFLREQGAPMRSWAPDPPDATAPEAEWGFDPELLEDIQRFAGARGYRVQRLRFNAPEQLSPIVASIYRDWYQRWLPERSPERLVVESFFLMDPWCALRTGAVPFWTVFNAQSSCDAVMEYLDRTGPFDDIHLAAFSHGVQSPGLAPMEAWRAVLRRARRKGAFLGVDPDVYPEDFRVFLRYHRQLRKIPRHGVPVPALPLPQLLEMIQRFGPGMLT